MIGNVTDFNSADKLIWACSCHRGGTVTRSGTTPATAVLETEVRHHLRERGNEGHAVDFGVFEGSARLDRTEPPLVWTREL